MDGNFSMAPRIFKQLYIIRAPLGDTAITCVYAFLAHKNQESYTEMLEAVVHKCEELGFNVSPQQIITDFEQTVFRAIRAVMHENEHLNLHGCFYHLTQSTWKKVQNLGLSVLYQENEEIRHFCGMLDGLSFLPLEQVPQGMAYLREIAPPELEPLVDYFDENYVSGRLRPRQQQAGIILNVRRLPPLFPPVIWNNRQITMEGGDRTNNICEGWNNGYMQLVGHTHPSFWKSIESIRKDEALNRISIINDQRGNPPSKKLRQTNVNLQQRLHRLCSDHAEGTKTMEEFLRGIGHTIHMV